MNNRLSVLAGNRREATQKFFETTAFEMVKEIFDGNTRTTENRGAPHDFQVDGDEVFETGEVHGFKARERCGP